MPPGHPKQTVNAIANSLMIPVTNSFTTKEGIKPEKKVFCSFLRPSYLPSVERRPKIDERRRDCSRQRRISRRQRPLKNTISKKQQKSQFGQTCISFSDQKSEEGETSPHTPTRAPPVLKHSQTQKQSIMLCCFLTQHRRDERPFVESRLVRHPLSHLHYSNEPHGCDAGQHPKQSVRN